MQTSSLANTQNTIAMALNFQTSERACNFWVYVLVDQVACEMSQTCCQLELLPQYEQTLLINNF
jgi:hypothetical protein